MTFRSLTALGGLALLALAVVRPAGAQEVAGRVVEEGTGAPVPGALVALRDSAGAEVAQTLTRGSGAYAIRAPRPGRYVLTVRRIGYRDWSSDPLRLAEGETTSLRAEVPVEAVELAEIEVEASERCTRSPESGPRTARLWDEAQKALTAARLTEGEANLRYRVVDYRRKLDAEADDVLSEDTSVRSGVGLRPYHSFRGERLAETGYVVPDPGGETATYYAPDARALLSDAFLRTHCFWVRDDPPGGDDDLVGLAFRPVDDREKPDIEGVLWLDRATAELRRLEFDYVDADHPPNAEHAGGRVEFRRLENGAWVIPRWWIRIPVRARKEVRVRRGYRVEVRTGWTTGAYLEWGGRVEEVRGPDGERLSLSARAELAGKVVEQGTGEAVGDAAVVLRGTSYRTTTGPDGRFRLRVPLEGRYRVAVAYPLLETAGLPPPVREVDLRPDERTTVAFEVPTTDSALAAACAGEEAPEVAPGFPRTSGVLGYVRDRQGRRVAGASVAVAWSKHWAKNVPMEGRRDPIRAPPVIVEEERNGLVTRTSRDGAYLVCSVPSHWTLRLQAWTPDAASPVDTLEIGKRRVRRRDLRLSLVPDRLELASREQAPADAEDALTAPCSEPPVGRSGWEGHPRTAGAAGRVLGAEGEPLAGATVRFTWQRYVEDEEGGLVQRRFGVETTTDEEGRYRACHLPAGWTVRMEVEVDGQTVEAGVLRVSEGEMAQEDVTLEVTAERPEPR